MLFSKKDLFKLIWPALVEQLLNVLVGMVDVLMVAAVGETAVSGVSLVDSISLLVLQVLAALSTGGAVVCSQFLGGNERENACKAGGQLISITVCGSLTIALICLAGGKSFLGLIFGQVEADVMSNAWIYFRITALSYPFLALFNSCAALFRAMGNSRISMKASMLMNAINVSGNALCIFVLKMGVAGVAIPTLFARAIAAVLIFVLLRDTGNIIHVRKVSDFVPDFRLVRRILSIGIPNGIEGGMFQFGKLILQSLVSTLGTASIAGYAVASNLVTFLYLPGNALGLIHPAVIGQSIGAGEYRQAKTYARWMVYLNYAFLMILATVFAFGRNILVQLYHLSPDASVIAAYLLLIHCIAMIIWPPAFCLPYALHAASDARFTMIVSVSVMWIFRVGGAYLLIRVFGLGVEGVWYAMFTDWFVRIIAYLLRFRQWPQILEDKFGKKN